MKTVILLLMLLTIVTQSLGQNWGDLSGNNPTFTSGQTVIGSTTYLNNTQFGVTNSTQLNTAYFSNTFSTTSTTYGLQVRNSGTNSGIRYGIYSYVYGVGTGIKYGIYSQCTGSNNYAGYFLGRSYFSDKVGIGITSPTTNLDINRELSVFATQTNNDVFRYKIFAHDFDSRLAIVPSVNGTYFWNRELSLYNDGRLTKEIDTETGIAFNVWNSNLGRDVFRVYGNGRVLATEIEIRISQSFPDYVFSKGYYLMPIDSVNNYIMENGHLPEVPPADSIHQNGLELSEMQLLQMKKIEELTLYIIQLNNRIKELETQLIKE